MSTKSKDPDAIPFKNTHRAGIWGGNIIGIIALIVAIVALLLALLYFPTGKLYWHTVTVTPSGGQATVNIENNTVFEIAGPSSNTQTTSITLSGGSSGQTFAIANTASTSGGSLIVGTGTLNVEIYPGTGVQFTKTDNRIVPYHPVTGVQSS